MGKVQTKVLVLKKFGWKRIAKNTQRFGWTLDDATEEEEITETHTWEGEYLPSSNKFRARERVDKSSKIRIWLTFYRYPSAFSNLGAIAPIEALYTLFFWVRRIVGFFLPLLTVAVFIVAAMGDGPELIESPFGPLYFSVFGVWIVLILLEGILSRIAAKILKRK